MLHAEIARRRVKLAYSVPLPFSRAEAWEWIRDFSRFVRIDPHHRGVIPPLTEPVPGARFRLLHGGLLVRIVRRGRILKVVEGKGYSFSDLSLRDPRKGFPHVFRVLLVDTPGGCRLDVEVTGRWTAAWVPMGCRRLWLTVTCRLHRFLLLIAARTRQARLPRNEGRAP